MNQEPDSTLAPKRPRKPRRKKNHFDVSLVPPVNPHADPSMLNSSPSSLSHPHLLPSSSLNNYLNLGDPHHLPHHRLMSSTSTASCPSLPSSPSSSTLSGSHHLHHGSNSVIMLSSCPPPPSCYSPNSHHLPNVPKIIHVDPSLSLREPSSCFSTGAPPPSMPYSPSHHRGYAHHLAHQQPQSHHHQSHTYMNSSHFNQFLPVSSVQPALVFSPSCNYPSNYDNQYKLAIAAAAASASGSLLDPGTSQQLGQHSANSSSFKSITSSIVDGVNTCLDMDYNSITGPGGSCIGSGELQLFQHSQSGQDDNGIFGNPDAIREGVHNLPSPSPSSTATSTYARFHHHSH